jgi:hypothetical protein
LLARKPFIGWVAILAQLLWVAAARPAAVDCPPGLREEAEFHRVTLQEAEWAVRDSQLGSARGVTETVQFDLDAHACHRGPGQAYREFDSPVCRAGKANARVPVRYAYRLFYRKALTLEALFKKDWKPGSDGILQVEFAFEGGRWKPVATRELLDMGTSGEHPGPE